MPLRLSLDDVLALAQPVGEPLPVVDWLMEPAPLNVLFALREEDGVALSAEDALPERDAETLKELLPLSAGDGLGRGEPEEDGEEEEDIESLRVAEPEGLPLGEGELSPLRLALDDRLTLAQPVMEPLRVAWWLKEPLPLNVLLALLDEDTVALRAADTLPERDAEPLTELLPLSASDGLGRGEPEADGEEEGDFESLGVAEPEGLPLELAEAPAVPLVEDEALCEELALAEEQREAREADDVKETIKLRVPPELREGDELVLLEMHAELVRVGVLLLEAQSLPLEDMLLEDDGEGDA